MSSQDEILKLIPFNRPIISRSEVETVSDCMHDGMVSGNGTYTRLCHEWFQAYIAGCAPFLTHSCAGALEMAGLITRLEPGDEVIMPSFTFSATANAVVLRGATPVFIDIRPDTLNIDETLIELAITPRTRMICVVHYAGVAAEMGAIMAIAKRHKLIVLEDAAQAIFGSYQGLPLGSIGHLGAFSFHATKNITSGEGGALVVNAPSMHASAAIAWDNGLNRGSFRRGEISAYDWQDVGSSFMPSEITAALLLTQLNRGHAITQRRLRLWNQYYVAFQAMEEAGVVRRPHIPDGTSMNGHIFYLIYADVFQRDRVIRQAAERGVMVTSHYVPLHLSRAGQRFGRLGSDLHITEKSAETIVRLPMLVDMTTDEFVRVVKAVAVDV